MPSAGLAEASFGLSQFGFLKHVAAAGSGRAGNCGNYMGSPKGMVVVDKGAGPRQNAMEKEAESRCIILLDGICPWPARHLHAAWYPLFLRSHLQTKNLFMNTEMIQIIGLCALPQALYKENNDGPGPLQVHRCNLCA